MIIEPVPAPTATTPPRAHGHDQNDSSQTSDTTLNAILDHAYRRSTNHSGLATLSPHLQQTFPSLPSSPNHPNSPHHPTHFPQKQKAAHSSPPRPVMGHVISIEPYAIYSIAMRSLIDMLIRFGYWESDILGMSRMRGCRRLSSH